MMAARRPDFVVEGYELGRKSIPPHVSIDKSFPRGLIVCLACEYFKYRSAGIRIRHYRLGAHAHMIVTVMA